MRIAPFSFSLQQQLIVPAPRLCQVGDNFPFVSANRQPILIQTKPLVGQGQALHSLFDLRPEALHQLKVALPDSFPQLLDLQTLYRLIQRTHVGLGVNDGNADEDPPLAGTTGSETGFIAFLVHDQRISDFCKPSARRSVIAFSSDTGLARRILHTRSGMATDQVIGNGGNEHQWYPRKSSTSGATVLRHIYPWTAASQRRRVRCLRNRVERSKPAMPGLPYSRRSIPLDVASVSRWPSIYGGEHARSEINGKRWDEKSGVAAGSIIGANKQDLVGSRKKPPLPGLGVTSFKQLGRRLVCDAPHRTG